MKRIMLCISAMIVSLMTFAQESTTKVDVNLDKGASTFPWLWVVGGLVFLVLLIALLNGGSRGSDNTVIERKTVVRE